MEATSHALSGPLTAAEAVIAWTPVELALLHDNPAWRETAGCVTVGPRGERCRLAAAYAHTATLAGEGEDATLHLFRLFNTLVLEHSIPPLIAHIALLDLVEYRAGLSPALADPARPRRRAEVVLLDGFRPAAAFGPRSPLD